jgi:hypothetical protein
MPKVPPRRPFNPDGPLIQRVKLRDQKPVFEVHLEINDTETAKIMDEVVLMLKTLDANMFFTLNAMRTRFQNYP